MRGLRGFMGVIGGVHDSWVISPWFGRLDRDAKNAAGLERLISAEYDMAGVVGTLD